MARKKRQIRIRVEGVKRKDVDTRRLARAIIRLAVDQGLASAQELADALEVEESQRSTRLKRGRKAERDAAEETTASQ